MKNANMILTLLILTTATSCCCGDPEQYDRSLNDTVQATPATDTDINPATGEPEGWLPIPTASPFQKAEQTWVSDGKIHLGSTDLDTQYEANEVKADMKFKGKRVLVDGVVKSIDKDFLDNIVLKLSGHNQFLGVRATMVKAEKAKAANLSKGQTIRVLCTSKGRLVGSASLADCFIVPEG